MPAKWDPGNLKILNFFLYFKIFLKKIYNDIMCSSEAKAMKFENF
jgi:hypothetical protein